MKNFSKDMNKSYDGAKAYLGNRKSKQIENHTKIEYIEGDIAVQLWYTQVVIYKPDGSIVLNSGGYNTVTTRDRISTYCPYGYVWTRDGDMIFGTVNRNEYEFKDDMVIGKNGIPNTRPIAIAVIDKLFPDLKLDTLSAVKSFIRQADLLTVKKLIRNRDLRTMIIENCNIEHALLFINDERFQNVIAERLKSNNQGGLL